MPRLTCLLLLLCPLLAFCAPQNRQVMNSSMEFRLRSLEAKYLELEQKEAALEVLVTDRLQELQQALLLAREENALLRARLNGEVPAPAPPVSSRTTPSATRPEASARTQQPPSRPAAKSAPAAPQASQPQPPRQPRQQAQPAAPAAFAVDASGTELYKLALQRIQSGQPAEAVTLLEKYVAENPSASLTPDAHYWLGEAHFFLGNYDQAILAFKDIAGRFPNHAKAPQAMLKIGYAYEKLQDPNNARFYLQALADEYPDSEPARLARQKIQQLGI